MARYVDADAFKRKLADKDIFFPALYENELNETPIADVVSTKAFEQVKWERDTAIEQLESYGVGFCENKELAEVVRCKNCKKTMETTEKWNDCEKFFCDRHHSFVLANDFCSYGERK